MKEIKNQQTDIQLNIPETEDSVDFKFDLADILASVREDAENSVEIPVEIEAVPAVGVRDIGTGAAGDTPAGKKDDEKLINSFRLNDVPDITMPAEYAEAEMQANPELAERKPLAEDEYDDSENEPGILRNPYLEFIRLKEKVIPIRLIAVILSVVAVWSAVFYSVNIRYAYAPTSVRAEWIRSCRESTLKNWIPEFFLDTMMIDDTLQGVVARKDGVQA